MYINAVDIAGNPVRFFVDSPTKNCHEKWGVVYFSSYDDSITTTYIKRDDLPALIAKLQQVYDDTAVTTLPPADAYRLSDGCYIAEIVDGQYVGSWTPGEAVRLAEKYREKNRLGATLDYWRGTRGDTFTPIHLTKRTVTDVTEDNPVTIS